MMRKTLWMSTLCWVLCIGCGSNAPKIEDTTESACLTRNAPRACGNVCEHDAECGPGTFCRGSTCDADCVVDDDCSNDETCTAMGRCAPTTDRDGGVVVQPDGGDECFDVSITPQRTVPNIFLIFDQSSSMDEPFGGVSSRLAAAKQALVGDDGLVRRLESIARFSLRTYYGNAVCPNPGTIVDLSLDNADEIYDTLNFIEPRGATPTGMAIHQATEHVMQNPPPEGPTVFLLSTDGEPNTCGHGDTYGGSPTGSEAARSGVLRAVDEAYDAGIETYVLGIAFRSNHLQDVANAGLGVDSGAKWWTADDVPGLQAALEEIVVSQIPCTVEVQQEINTNEACRATVALEGESLPCENVNRGWRANDPHTIELLGSACSDWRSGAFHSLTGNFPCGSIVVE